MLSKIKREAKNIILFTKIKYENERGVQKPKKERNTNQKIIQCTHIDHS